MLAMLVLFAGIGYALGYAFMQSPLAGLVIAVAIACFLAFLSWNAGDAMILGSSRAHKIEREDHPVLFNVVEEMRIASGLPKMPDVYIIDADAPNAFATGRDPEHAKIAVTAGLLERLDRDELQGVIGHEMGHVANRDILYMMMATVLLGAIVILADVGFYAMLFGGAGGRRRTAAGGGGQAQAIMMLVALALVILAPLFAQLLYFALSRRREYLADACSARYTRYPEGLARALEKIAGNSEPLPEANRATAALFIANPLKIGAQGLTDLSSTHPPISERIRILRSMAGEISYSAYDNAFRQVTGRAVGVVPFSGLQEQGERAAGPARAASPESPRTRRARVRETTDALWSAQGYRFIRCQCGTTLKVPPRFPKDVVTCPNCGRDHRLDER